jgi:hypothetical protein
VAKYDVLVGIPMADNFLNIYLSQWLFQISEKIRKLQLPIDNFLIYPVIKFPTDCARNSIVEFFLKTNNWDILFMLDTDSVPALDWFEQSLQFLFSTKEPIVLASPYCGADGSVMVHRWRTDGTGGPHIEKYTREESAIKTGYEQVGQIGSHCCVLKRNCFLDMKPPYFQYGYNPDHTSIIETEECYAFRQMASKGIKLFVDWDRWAWHWKMKCLTKPHAFEVKDINPDWLNDPDILKDIVLKKFTEEKR